MNAMTNAMKEAGVKTPSIMYRVWNWLKDHPEKTVEDITTALGSSYNLNGQVSEMYKRGMLTVYKDKSRKTGLRGVAYMVKRYSVANPKQYELLPLPKRPAPAVEPKKVTPIVTERAFDAAMRVIESKAAPAFSDKQLVQKYMPKKAEMTEAEKFAAYLEFKQLMKEMDK